MLTSFNPVKFSNEENQWLLKHLGEATVVAMRDIHPAKGPAATAVGKPDKNPVTYPDGVNPASVKPIIEGINELIELEKADGAKWVGVEKVKAAIQTWLDQSAKWENDHKRFRGAPRWPSLYSYDSKGRPHWGGPGSDSGEVRTYFGPAGERIPFEITLLADYIPDWVAPADETEAVEPLLKVDSEANRIECMIPLADGGRCGHTESYKTGSRASYNAARARMSKHLRKATLEAEAHRELHTNEFGAGRAQ